jgi:ribose transport system permease protein
VAGVILLGVVRNSLNLLGVSAYWQWVIQGIILVSVVISDVYMNRSRRTA